MTDGDTLRLTNGARVRLIGIDTPETQVSPRSGGDDQPFALDAKSFTRRATESGSVRLEFDKERIDRYGRFLAYVWYLDRESEQELLLNEELVRAGLARARLGYSYSDAMKRRFRAAEFEARQARRGIWALDETEPQSRIDRFPTHSFIARIGRSSGSPNPGLPAGAHTSLLTTYQ